MDRVVFARIIILICYLVLGGLGIVLIFLYGRVELPPLIFRLIGIAAIFAAIDGSSRAVRGWLDDSPSRLREEDTVRLTSAVDKANESVKKAKEVLDEISSGRKGRT